MRSDWKALEQIEADDLIFTEADGSVTHKSDQVASLRSGDLKFESIDMSDVAVLDFGSVAVVTGKLVEKVRYKTMDLSGTYRFTDVWVKELASGSLSRVRKQSSHLQNEVQSLLTRKGELVPTTFGLG